jgi:hypothetical protein
VADKRAPADGRRACGRRLDGATARARVYDSPNFALAVAVAGHHIFVADRLAGLQIVDVADPAKPRLVATLDTPGAALDVALQGPLAFVADGDRGVRVVDVSEPAAPRALGAGATPGSALTSTLRAGLPSSPTASRVRILDVSDPAAPRAGRLRHA